MKVRIWLDTNACQSTTAIEFYYNVRSNMIVLGTRCVRVLGMRPMLVGYTQNTIFCAGCGI